MTKTDLITVVQAQTTLSSRTCREAVEAVVAVITAALQQGESVRIVGFGHFQVRQQPARLGRHPSAQAGGPSPGRTPAPGLREWWDHRAVRGIHAHHDADSGLDADGRAPARHRLRHVLQHPVPRVLPPPGRAAVRVAHLAPHARLL
jgi:nucleoid DNA-binding protein